MTTETCPLTLDPTSCNGMVLTRTPDSCFPGQDGCEECCRPGLMAAVNSHEDDGMYILSVDLSDGLTCGWVDIRGRGHVSDGDFDASDLKVARFGALIHLRGNSEGIDEQGMCE